MIRMRPRIHWLLLSALIAPLVWAGKPPPGADLLEFLGSVDSDDGSWSKYLGSTDLDQVVKPGPPKSPARAAPPEGMPAKISAPAPMSPPAPAPKAGS